MPDVRVGGVVRQVESRRERSKRERMERIKQAAYELLTEHDFNDVTTKDIAERADIGEATLFRYVANKLQLLVITYGTRFQAKLEVITKQAAELCAETEGVTGERIIETVLDGYRGYCEVYLTSPNNVGLYLLESYNRETSDRETVIVHGDVMISVATDLIVRGQQLGVLRADVDAALVGENCLGLFVHEVFRTRSRGLEHEKVWERLRPRLETQLALLVDDEQP
ncbi:TetR/AcrR family transcriptional regulator [Nocardioides sp.]|uniref:TetR/AcrR family transcriptional regulator n=1 Tax=Nocardioides sp. TaxID=35761 RepID=UPI0039E61377